MHVDNFLEYKLGSGCVLLMGVDSMDLSARKVPNSRENENNRDRRKKQNKKPKRFQELVKVIFVIFLLYLIINFLIGFFQAYNLKKDISSLNTEVEVLKEENYKLKKEVEYTQSAEAIETLARDKFVFVKEGEIIVMPSRKMPD